MVNEYGAQKWAYGFQNNIPEGYRHYEKMKHTDRVYIYAFSEEEARKKYAEIFGVEAQTLVLRSPW